MKEYRSRVDTGVVIDWRRVLDAFAKESKKFCELSMTNLKTAYPEDHEFHGKWWEEVRNKNFIVDFVYLALIVFLEPLRLVFGEVRVIEHDDPPKDGNIYIRPTRTLVLRKYKTVRTFGEQAYDLGGSDLGDILERSLVLYPRSHLVTQYKKPRDHDPPCMGTDTHRISMRIINIIRNIIRTCL